MVQLQEELSSTEHGYRVLAVAQDSPQTNARVMKQQKLDFPILSDGEMAASNGFGLSFKIDDKTVELYKKYNIDLVGLYGRSRPLMATPGVFVINKEGKIRFSYVNPDYKERVDTKVLLAAMAAYK